MTQYLDRMTSGLIDDIVLKLSQPTILSDVFSIRLLLSRVLMLSHDYTDITPLIPALVKLLAHPDILTKKISSQLLVKCSVSQSDSMLLAVNTVLRDTQDSNPTIRGLALRTMSQMQNETFQDQLLDCVRRGLEDSSVYVRRSAVCACVSIGRQDPDQLMTVGLVDQLYHLVRDPDPLVVINCLLGLEEILSTEQGVVLSRTMVRYLLTRLGEFDAWSLAFLFKLLNKYVPKSEDEVFSMMDTLDPFLGYPSLSVCIQCLELFLHLAKDMQNLSLEVFKRVKPTILNVFASGNTEMMVCVLQYMRKYPDTLAELFSDQYKSFFCRHKDHDQLKEQKLWIVTSLINTENFKDILEEIVLLCRDRSLTVSLCAVQSLRSIMIKFPEISESLLKAFQTLLSSGTSHVQSNTLQVLVTLPDINTSGVADLMSQLCPLAEKITDTAGRIAILTLIGRYGDTVCDSTYTLELFLNRFGELDTELKSHFLTTVLRQFQKRSPECQRLLAEVLELCLQDVDRDLKEQAKFCYALLENFDTLQALQFD